MFKYIEEKRFVSHILCPLDRNVKTEDHRKRSKSMELEYLGSYTLNSFIDSKP